MKLTLEEIRTKKSRKSFEIERNEADNIVVGRSHNSNAKFNDDASQLQISKSDPYLSRWHFLFQIRSPNCFISDISSLNHTFVNDFKKGNHIKDTVLLKDGDIIKAGRTYLKVHIVPDDISADERIFCALCGSEMTSVKSDGTDIMCSICSQNKEVNIATNCSPQLQIQCSKCGAKLDDKINLDGRAAELSNIAQYICDKCIDSERKSSPEFIGDYEILAELGKGGMGIVYKAVHVKTGRLAALKRILPKTSIDKRTAILFQREINIMKNITHPNVVRLYEAGDDNENLYFTSEYLAGGSVDDQILNKRKALMIEESCRIILHVLEGLSYIHGKGYVHRDISPSNLLIAIDGTVKLSDMGLSKNYESAGQSGITMTGETAGKILYMAPEQITNYRFVKPSADIYSIGIVFYYLLTGKFPYEFPTPLDVLMDFVGKKKKKEPIAIILEDKPMPIRERDKSIPKSIARVVDRAIDKSPEKRQRTAEEMRLAILNTMRELPERK